MSLSVGSRVGPYEVVAPIGAGGMGEVFRANDTKLNRAVALKVLPSSFSADADRVARFRREAQTLASLNHTNIAAIYGLEEWSGSLALVMELVEGDDLAARLRGGPLPLDEALSVASQLVDALEAAHERGVIHRDLKPANIKLRADGTLKVLDFGLAKALSPEGSSAAADAMNSPTLTVRATEMGMILGTAAYMAPEQARGKPVDKRADIWAFGVVLFEMLTGKQLFPGETMTDTLAAVLTHEPAWASLPAATPPGVRRLLARCLERDPKKRLRDIGDARLELQSGGAEAAAALPAPAIVRARPAARVLPWLVAAAALVFALWAISGRDRGGPLSTEVMYLDIASLPDVEFVRVLNGGVAISPDGRSIILIGVKNGARRLFVMALGRPEAREIPDTSGANAATFSADNKHVAFVTNGGELVSVSLADQQRVQMATGVDQSGSLIWSRAGLVYNRGGAIWIAPPAGAPRALTTLDSARREVLHASLTVLPDDETVLFSSMTPELGGERIEAIKISGGARSVVLDRASTPRFSPSGHLLFARDGALLAAPFDPATAKVGGSAVPVMPAGMIGMTSAGGLAYYLAPNGTLVFAPAEYNTNRLVSVAHDGAALTLDMPAAGYSNPRVSPDGRRLIVESGGTMVELMDLARGTHSRLTAPAVGTSFVSWMSDGQRVLFRRFNVPAWVSADGSGKDGVLPGGLVNDYPSAAGPDPDSGLVVRVRPESTADIYLMSLSGAFEPKVLVASRAYEGGAQLSPDGKWLLYQSNASGPAEIYVRRYPQLDRAWQVSAGGGVQPRWNPATKEICYRGGGKMMAVPFNGSAAEPVSGKPQPLFADEYDFGQGISIPNYDITRDGRFIMLRRGSRSGTVRAVINWTEELKRIVAAGRTP